jgi:hypothetical protein
MRAETGLWLSGAKVSRLLQPAQSLNTVHAMRIHPIRAAQTRRRRPLRVGLPLLVAALATAPVGAEGDSEASGSHELVPEFNGYFKLTDRSRLFLLADVSRVSPDEATNGELGIHFDYTLMPMLRPRLRDAEWERDRYLWLRIGARRLGSIDGRDDGFRESRLLLEATARFELPAAAWLVHRARWDLRDVDGKHSNRYRYRIGVEKELKVGGTTPVVTYAQAEWFYDTRFDAWSRQRYQLGTEIELDKGWRIEPYYAYDKDKFPSVESVNRLGLVLKYYR